MSGDLTLVVSWKGFGASYIVGMAGFCFGGALCLFMTQFQSHERENKILRQSLRMVPFSHEWSVLIAFEPFCQRTGLVPLSDDDCGGAFLCCDFGEPAVTTNQITWNCSGPILSPTPARVLPPPGAMYPAL